MVCFGGVALKNSAVNPGGTTEHPTREAHSTASRARRHTSSRSARCATTSTATANGSPRCPAPTWPSCWRWPTCWRPRDWPTATSWPATARATRASSATCSARDDGVAEVTAVGSGDQRPARRRPRRAGPSDGRRPHDGDGQLVAAARPPRRAGPVDGDHTGSDARPDRPCQEAVSGTATVRRTNSACRRCAAGSRPSRRASTRSGPSSRSRQSATCCCTRASRSTTTVGR